MSILIKGMEMPKNCYTCWALDDYGDYPRCRITEEQRGYNFQIREKRMDKCPLVPVPPHGDLIERDKIVFEDDYYGWRDKQVVKAAPTIIPEEEET